MKIERKKLDFLVVILLNVLTGLYTYLTRDLYIGKMLFAGLLTQALPILYLSLRSKKDWRKILLAMVIFDFLFESFDFVAEYTHTWNVISVVLPKLFGVLPLDNIITHESIIVYTLVFYEHFFGENSDSKISKNIFHPIIYGSILFIGAAFAFFLDPHLLSNIRYPFLYLGSLAVTPLIILCLAKPKLFQKIAVSGVYFFFYYFATELIASHRYWIYTGNNYIGWVSFFGMQFPFEEYFFWVILYGPTIIAYYKLWITGTEND